MSSAAASSVRLSCVVLTMGDRPEALRRAVDGLLSQHGDPVEVVVVGNGADVTDLPPAVRFLRLELNEGIPGGRNAGVEQTSGDVVMFLDDDGELPDPGVAGRLRSEFAADPSLGIVSLRIVDPASGTTARRHVPRLRAGDPRRSSYVTTFLGGACALRRAVLTECGGLPSAFFYAHEETDLAWRALDAGWRIRYDAGAVMYHPRTLPSRHAAYQRFNARNRVWLARRLLPAPLIPVYLGVWAALTALRVREPALLTEWARGFIEGVRTDAGPRKPISWSTVARMTRLGRPPVV